MVREDDLDDDEADDEEASSPPRRKRTRAATRRTSPRPVKRWKGQDGEGEEEGDEPDEYPSRKRRWISRDEHPVYWRARDSLYFEPLVAVAIIVLLLVGLYAYTQNWPPVYVVESSSMQHGSTDIVGLINAGDLVLAQKIPTSRITTYVQGLQTGYTTYGEYGDVVLYYANGVVGTPTIHRAILYLQWDALPDTGGYNATQLLGLPCGDAAGAVFNLTSSGSTTPAPCTTRADLTDLTGTLTLYHIGWRDAVVTIPLSPGQLGAHNGFLTMGDNNFVGGSDDCTPGVSCQGYPDQLDGHSALVEPGWIVGVARGMLPWFGALKLLIEGNTQYVPPQSWQFLGITIAGLILLAFGIHYAFRAEGVQDPRRRSEDDEDEEDDDERPPGWARRFLQGIRPWHRDDEEDEEEPDVPKRRPSTRPPPGSSPSGHRGRPPPRVRRAKRAKRRSDDSDDD